MEFGIFIQGYVPGPRPTTANMRRSAHGRGRDGGLRRSQQLEVVWVTEHHALPSIAHLGQRRLHGYLARMTERIHSRLGNLHLSPA